MAKVIFWGLAAGVLITGLMIFSDGVSATVGEVSNYILDIYDQHVLDRHAKNRDRPEPPAQQHAEPNVKYEDSVERKER